MDDMAEYRVCTTKNSINSTMVAARYIEGVYVCVCLRFALGILRDLSGRDQGTKTVEMGCPGVFDQVLWIFLIPIECTWPLFCLDRVYAWLCTRSR